MFRSCLAWMGLLLTSGAFSTAPMRSEAPPIVFVSRALAGEPEPATRQRAIERARSGRLMVLESDGSLRELVNGMGDGTPVDVIDPDVSFDGRRIVFAGYSPGELAWRIYEIQADGTGLRQVTRSDRQTDLSRYGAAAEIFRSYDDVDPCYLPGGRICFVSTRYPGVAPDGRLRTTNLYVVNEDGSDLHRITTERFGADTPAVDPRTGQIVYSRWWRTAQTPPVPGSPPPAPIPPGSPGYGDAGRDPTNAGGEPPPPLRGVPEADFPGVNSWFLAGIDPDGTDMAMYSGFRLDRALTQAYRPSFTEGGEALALFIPRTPFLGFPGGNGLRLFQRGPSSPVPLGGPQHFPGSPFLFDRDQAISPHFYASAASLPDGSLLVSAALFGVAGYGLYRQEDPRLGTRPPVVLRDLPGTDELDAVPLIRRPLPPVIADTARGRLSEAAPRTVEEAFAEGGRFVFQVENIFANAPVNVPIPHAPPIGQGLAIEFYMNPQRQSRQGSDPPILIRREEVPFDGKLRVELPAGVPLFELLRRTDGTLAQGRDGQIFHVGGMNFGRAGETNRCVGCHAGHSQMTVPPDPAWTNLAPSTQAVAGSVLQFDATHRHFDPVNLTDRRTGERGTDWASVFTRPAMSVELRWSARLRAAKAVLWGIQAGAGAFGKTDVVVHGLTLETLLDGKVLKRLEVAQDIVPGGTEVPLDPSLEFNALRLTALPSQVTGLFEGQRAFALAELEVIGQAASKPRGGFLRGDADANRAVDIADPVKILGHLFLGMEPPRCRAAADANDDGMTDISDPAYLLRFLFLGGAPPPAPFPACGPLEVMTVACDVQICP